MKLISEIYIELDFNMDEFEYYESEEVRKEIERRELLKTRREKIDKLNKT